MCTCIPATNYFSVFLFSCLLEQKTWATGRDHVVRNIPEHITSSGSMDLSLSTEINRTQVKDCLVDRCSPGQTHLKTNDLNNLSMFHSQNKTFKTINLPFDGQSSCQGSELFINPHVLIRYRIELL